MAVTQYGLAAPVWHFLLEGICFALLCIRIHSVAEGDSSVLTWILKEEHSREGKQVASNKTQRPRQKSSYYVLGDM